MNLKCMFKATQYHVKAFFDDLVTPISPNPGIKSGPYIIEKETN
jgi:hypothetical protein